MRLNLLRATASQMRTDLTSPPVVGDERLGIAFTRYASKYTQRTIVVTEYAALPEEAYVREALAPVSFDVRWIMTASENAGLESAGIFLVHLHEHRGKPWFSPVDMDTNRRIITPIALIDQTLPTGALILSLDSAAALVARGDGLVAVAVHEIID